MNKRMRKKRLGVIVDKSQYIDSLVERGVITEPEWILAPGEAKRLKSFKWGQEPAYDGAISRPAAMQLGAINAMRIKWALKRLARVKVQGKLSLAE